MKSIKSILPALAAVFALSMAAPALAQTAQPSAMAPAAQPSAMAPAASSAMAPAKTTKTVKAKTTKAKVASFKSETEAKASCPMDTVVWGSPKSKAYHVSTSKLYGKTKTGAYICEKTATAAGYHAAKN